VAETTKASIDHRDRCWPRQERRYGSLRVELPNQWESIGGNRFPPIARARNLLHFEVGILDVVVALATRGTGGLTIIRSSTRLATRGTGHRGPRSLEDGLKARDLGLELVGVITLHRLLQVGNGGFELALVVGIELVAVFLHLLLGLVDHRIGLVLQVDQFASLLVVASVGFGIGGHAINFVLADARTDFDRDL